MKTKVGIIRFMVNYGLWWISWHGSWDLSTWNLGSPACKNFTILGLAISGEFLQEDMGAYHPKQSNMPLIAAVDGYFTHQEWLVLLTEDGDVRVYELQINSVRTIPMTQFQYY